MELAQFKGVNLVSPLFGRRVGHKLNLLVSAGLLTITGVMFSPLIVINTHGAVVADKPLNAERPLTLKDVCLLLRGGYTNDEVLAEVATRRLLDPIDGAAEKQLQASGGTPAFINALKAGNYNLSAADADAARRKQAAIAQREQAGRAAEAQVAAQNQTAANQQQGASDAAKMLEIAQRNKNQPLRPAKSQAMANLLRGKLKVWHDKKFMSYNDSLLTTKRIYGIYFSASWCPPCQQFTPKLVNLYDKLVQLHPEFEIILVCRDRSAEAMQKYMDGDHMNWPAVPFENIMQMTGLTKYAGSGIPDLVLVDDSGKVLSDSYQEGEYVGPELVVKDLMKILNTPQ